MRQLLLINVLLALAWCAAFGTFTLSNLIIGFLVGGVVLWVSKPLYGDTGYFRHGRRLARLVVVFLVELMVSSIRVAWDVVTPRNRSRPGVVAVPMDAKTDLELTLLANLISLTPGTLSLDISDDRRVLYVHAMFVDSREGIIDDIKSGMEKSLLEVMR